MADRITELLRVALDDTLSLQQMRDKVVGSPNRDRVIAAAMDHDGAVTNNPLPSLRLSTFLQGFLFDGAVAC